MMNLESLLNSGGKYVYIAEISDGFIFEKLFESIDKQDEEDSVYSTNWALHYLCSRSSNNPLHCESICMTSAT